MYKVLLDGALMCDSRIEELALINPIIELEENKAGSFSFKIPPGHPMHGAIQRRKSVIQVVKNKELLFSGICIEVTEDFFKQQEVYCEGEFSYFNDSIQRPARYKNYTVAQLLETFVASHNAQVEEQKQFQVGTVTVEGTYDSYCYTNMETTMNCFKADLVNKFGGYFRVRYEEGVKYIDYLKGSQNVNSQVIRLGKNLLDYTSNIDSTDIATAIIPLGDPWGSSPVKGISVKRTIEKANDGVDYLYNQEAVDTFGWIFKTVEFPDIRKASTLKQKGEEYLSDLQFENVVIEAKAIDLSNVDSSIESFKISDSVRVISEKHGMDRYFRVTYQRINLNNPEKDTVTLGASEQLGLSSQTSSAISKGQTSTSEQIASAMGGYVCKSNEEILIMDTDDIETATKVWKWDLNGLSYSDNGYYGDYSIAITMDGKIAGKFLEVNSVSADKVVLEGLSTKDGKFQIREDGTVSATGDIYATVLYSDAVYANLFDVHVMSEADYNYYSAFNIGWAEGAEACGRTYITSETNSIMFEPLVVFNNGFSNLSDRARKNSIEALDEEKTSEFVYSLKPCKFKYNEGRDDRFVHGLIAQDVEESMNGDEWSLLTDVNPKEEGFKSLQYEQLIADLIATVQSQNKRIKALEEKAGGTNE